MSSAAAVDGDATAALALSPPHPPPCRASTAGAELMLGSGSEDDAYEHLIEVQQEKQTGFIPVKAYFISTSIDLRNLQAHNAFNVIPPTSRASNYVVLRYYDHKADHHTGRLRCPACRMPYDKERIVGMAANCERVVAGLNNGKK